MQPSYIEIGAPNDEPVKKFFGELFDWPYTPMENGGWFDTGSVRAGVHGGDPIPGIVVYFEVKDIEAAVKRVIALGGQSDEPSPNEPGFGRFANCVDPQGIKFGLRQIS